MKHDQSGFSLIETMVAMGILATGLLGLAGVFTVGMAHMATSSANLIAREKAREAIESVHTARDTQTIKWCQIYNVSSTRTDDCETPTVAPAGVFLDGDRQIKDPGDDGLVNTADDGAVSKLPGPDGVLGTSDDIPLTNFTRSIAITNVVEGSTVNANLKQIVVTIKYSVGPIRRTYVLTTYVSSIS